MKAWKVKENFADIHVHNILRLFDGWVKFPFHRKFNELWLLVTKWYIPVASEFLHELRIRILEN